MRNPLNCEVQKNRTFTLPVSHLTFGAASGVQVPIRVAQKAGGPFLRTLLDRGQAGRLI